jgi:hypothetical protein
MRNHKRQPTGSAWLKARGVALALLLGLAVTGCDGADPARPFPRSVGKGVQQVGFLTHPNLKESSGLIPCHGATNLFWTHNDGRRPILYAVTKTGETEAEVPLLLPGVMDWEDIASDHQGHLYIGDIGNNDARRQELAVYEINEPSPRSTHTPVLASRAWRLQFPAQPFDCESLFVYRNFGYVISKVFNDAQAALYRFPLTNGTRLTLEKVCDLPVTSPVTGADITPDGDRLALVCKSGALGFVIRGDPARAGSVKPRHIKFRHEHIEAACFTPEGLLTTAESREMYLFTDRVFRYPYPPAPKNPLPSP